MNPLRDLFGLDPDLVFLNHGSFGACPLEVLAELQRWQRETERNPVQFLGRRSGALLDDARSALAALLGAQAEDIAFVPNATHGVNLVARSLRLRPGDEVLGSGLEYGACDATWQRLCDAAGARYRRAPIALPLVPQDFAAQLMCHAGPRTRLVFCSHLASTTALVLPVAELVAAAHARGLPVLIDGAHAPGQIDLDLDALGADYYTGNGHKWLCGPKGSAFVHVRRDRQEALEPTVVSWGLVEGTGGHTGFEAFVGRGPLQRRLQWQGTRDLSPWLALPAALDFHRRHLGPEVRQRCHELACDFMHRVCARLGTTPIAPDGSFAQMVAVPLPEVDAEALRSHLFDRHRIEVPVTQHEDRVFVRVSVQGYNEPAELRQLESALLSQLEGA